jgi:hypothetical protein
MQVAESCRNAESLADVRPLWSASTSPNELQSALSKFFTMASSGLLAFGVALLTLSRAADILSSTTGRAIGSACRPMASAPSKISMPLVIGVTGAIMHEI